MSETRPLTGYLTPAETARQLGISTSRLKQLRQAGEIRGWWSGLGFLYPPEDVARLRAARQQLTSGSWSAPLPDAADLVKRATEPRR